MDPASSSSSSAASAAAFSSPVVAISTSSGASSSSIATSSKEPPKILIVSSCPVQKLVIKSTLRAMRLKFDEAESGEDAIKYFEERNEYDLVFVSKELPGMNGFQTIHHLKETMGVSIPIIATSPDTTVTDRNLFYSAGAKFIVAEPILKEEIIRIVNFCLFEGKADFSAV